MQSRLSRYSRLFRRSHNRENEVGEAGSRTAGNYSEDDFPAIPNDTRTRVLMLGNGGTQLLKTMQISQRGRISSEEIPIHRDWIQGTVFNAMEALLKELILPKAEKSEISTRAQTLLDHCDSANELTPEIAADFKVLWAGLAMKHTVPLLFRTAPYFFDEVDRIAHTNYVPSMADLIRIPSRSSLSAVMTPNVLTLAPNRSLYVFNGERQKGSPRQQWSENFKDVLGIIFTIDLCSYNQFRPDNPRRTKLMESLALWDAVINSKFFTKSMIFLVMSNAAEFKEKIKVYPLSDTFPVFTGGDDGVKAARFISDCFRNADRSRGGAGIDQHIVDPMDSKDVQNTWMDIENILYRLENYMRTSA